MQTDCPSVRSKAPTAATRPTWAPGRARVSCLLLLLTVFLAACGGSGGPEDLGLGTVALRNESNLGMAPRTIEQFFLQPVGVVDAGSNRLVAPLTPGSIVIVGLFPAGLYNATAVLEGGFNVNFQDMEVRAGQATNFIVP